MSPKKPPASKDLLDELGMSDAKESPEELARLGSLLERIQKAAREQQPEESAQSRISRQMPHDGEEFFIVLCPQCNGEAIYCLKNPCDQVMDVDDWGATYKNFGAPWQHKVIPCQKCMAKGTVAPICCEFLASRTGGKALELEPGVYLDPTSSGVTWIIRGLHERFVTTRTYQEERRRVAAAERAAINARRETLRRAKAEAQQ